MAVQSTMTNRYIKPADAVKQSKASRTSGAVGQTDRGTAIVTANSGMDKNAFLNLLVAQMTNMDPTQDQDSTAYVTQLAQFSSIEQMSNLNTTMLNFSYQQMVGHVAILKDLDENGQHKFGLINQVFKSGNTTYANIVDVSTGKTSNYEISSIIGVSDSGYTNANFETALNSNFIAASQLASSNAKAVVIETVSKDIESLDKDNNKITTTTTTTTAKKCIVQSAYLDKQQSKVFVTVELLDDKGEKTGETKVYDYDSIVIAGNLTDKVMEETAEKYNKTTVTSRDSNGVAVDNPSHKDNNTNAGDSVSGSNSSSESGTDSGVKSDEKVNEESQNPVEDKDDEKESEKNTGDGTNSKVDNPTVESSEAAKAYAKEAISANDKRSIEEEDKLLARIAGI